MYICILLLTVIFKGFWHVVCEFVICMYARLLPTETKLCYDVLLSFLFASVIVLTLREFTLFINYFELTL